MALALPDDQLKDLVLKAGLLTEKQQPRHLRGVHFSYLIPASFGSRLKDGP